ncbi:ABC transporter ATP-binding protein [soil metagenome]
MTLQLNDVGLTFGGNVEALRNVSLTIPDGEFISIVGPSGCGKSTLLRIIAGLLAPSAGTISGAGRRGENAFVFQQPALLPWRSVEANIRLPLELQGTVDSASRERVSQLIELVGLREFRGAYPNQLSGGMQMRVSLARALVTRPRLLLLDEPFAALDDITRQRLNEELLALWERDRFTAIFVTHNVSEAVYLGGRVLVMTARPGSIAREVAIPFEYPRAFSLRSDAEFARLAGDVGGTLREHYE